MSSTTEQPRNARRGCSFSPAAIVDHFGSNGLAPSVICALFRQLPTQPQECSGPAYQRWRNQYFDALGIGDQADAQLVHQLAQHHQLRATTLGPLLFSIHTYYALFIKLLCAHILDIAELDGDCSQSICEALEDGPRWGSMGIEHISDDHCFDWYLAAWSEDLATSIDVLSSSLATYDRTTLDVEGLSRDLLRDLYHDLLPRSVRHDLGEYYTPPWLAELTLDELRYDGDPRQRILDPACGSGVFLVAIINRFKQWLEDHIDALSMSRSQALRHLLDNAIGVDINPLAVLACRANYLLALRDMIDDLPDVALPVYRHDSLNPPDSMATIESFDMVVGNPPWINWQNLDETRRHHMKPQWESYGLFSLSGSKGRLGGGKKDLSMLFTYACCDHYLRPEGKLGFLITQSVFKSQGAGDGFRRFRYTRDGQSIYLSPLKVHDFTDFDPFENASTNAALLCLQKQAKPFDYPVPYWKWRRPRGVKLDATISLSRARELLETTPRAARPVDPEHDASPWLTAPRRALDGLIKVIGDSDYQAYEGVNSGGLNGCFWVREIQRTIDGFVQIENLHDVGRIKVEARRQKVESKRLFPLLRSGDLDRWRATAQDCILLGQDPHTRRGIPEDEMKRDTPLTYAYFKAFEGDPDDVQRGTLRGRSLFKRYYKPSDPFYSMYGVGPYTMSAWKVCWTRIDTRLRAAVVGPDDCNRIVLPQETITFVPLENEEEAHYFCALFNSSPADALVRCYSSGKGFASAHVLNTINIPFFDATNRAHNELARLSQNCHETARNGDCEALSALRRRIDDRAAQVWDLADAQLRGIQQALSEL